MSDEEDDGPKQGGRSWGNLFGSLCRNLPSVGLGKVHLPVALSVMAMYWVCIGGLGFLYFFILETFLGPLEDTYPSMYSLGGFGKDYKGSILGYGIMYWILVVAMVGLAFAISYIAHQGSLADNKVAEDLVLANKSHLFVPLVICCAIRFVLQCMLTSLPSWLGWVKPISDQEEAPAIPDATDADAGADESAVPSSPSGGGFITQIVWMFHVLFSLFSVIIAVMCYVQGVIETEEQIEWEAAYLGGGEGVLEDEPGFETYGAMEDGEDDDE